MAGGASWEAVDDLPQGRSMGQFIQLPDGKLWFGNGVTTGVAGYNTNPNAPGRPVGESYGDNPSYQPLVYDPKASKGNRWKRVGSSNIGRLYHSSATLLPDSSILVAGSNPNADYNTNTKWKTEYRVERWYPSSTMLRVPPTVACLAPSRTAATASPSRCPRLRMRRRPRWCLCAPDSPRTV